MRESLRNDPTFDVQFLGMVNILSLPVAVSRRRHSAYIVKRTTQQFGQSILTKMITIVDTRCHILRLRCTKFDFDWGCAPDSAGSLQPRWILGCILLRGREGKEAGKDGED